jgi:hypothetical protein
MATAQSVVSCRIGSTNPMVISRPAVLWLVVGRSSSRRVCDSLSSTIGSWRVGTGKSRQVLRSVDCEGVKSKVEGAASPVSATSRIEVGNPKLGAT